MTIDITTSSETGPRSENQDCMAIVFRKDGETTIVRDDQSITFEEDGDYLLVAIVCDGMGGLKDGAMVSRMIVDSVVSWTEEFTPSSPDSSIKSLKMVLMEAESKMMIEYPGSGTTVSIVIGTEEWWLSAHIGDSRCYVVSNDIWRTSDHSPVEEMFREGIIDEDSMNTSCFSNIVSKYIGGGFAGELEVDDISTGWKRVVVCSDGAFGYMNTSDFKTLLTTARTAEDIVISSLDNGGRDNTTVVILNRDSNTRR